MINQFHFLPFSREFAKNLGLAQDLVAGFFRALRFRRKGRTYNRRCKDGVTHVVNFRLGPDAASAGYMLSPCHESPYNTFDIYLGILLPCVYEVEHERRPPTFIQEYFCTIRTRISRLATGSNGCFHLDFHPDQIATGIVAVLDEFGLPFLDQFSDYASVLDYFEEHCQLPFLSVRDSDFVVDAVAYHVYGYESFRPTPHP